MIFTAIRDPFLPIYDLTDIPTDEELATQPTPIPPSPPIWVFPANSNKPTPRSVQEIFDAARAEGKIA